MLTPFGVLSRRRGGMNTRRVVVSGGSQELTTALEQLVPASLMAAEIEPGRAQWGHEKTWRHDGLGMIRAEGAGVSRQIERIDHHCSISTEAAPLRPRLVLVARLLVGRISQARHAAADGSVSIAVVVVTCAPHMFFNS